MVTGSMAGMRVHMSAVAASCTARRFCRSSLYDGLLGRASPPPEPALARATAQEAALAVQLQAGKRGS